MSAGRGAAFFDVDRTLLAGASGLHLVRPMRRHGLISARQLARAMLVQLAFAARGSDDEELDRYTEGVKELMAGWDHDTVVRIIEQELESRVHPMVYREALERIEQHRSQGLPVYAVSATMEEIIEPLAQLLGIDGAVAAEMEVVDGTFTGAITRTCHGPEKAVRLREFAAANDIDLEASVAYSDSITDADFLRAVGRAYAVNPDKELRALAEQEGWGILRFATRVRAPLHQRRGARIGVMAIAGTVAAGLFARSRAAEQRNLRGWRRMVRR